jgi:hypothetical protein
MALQAGARLGPYEIIGPLGAGGMGEVYKASDTRLRRSVALKVLPATHATDPDRLRRFEQEALAAAALNHPNLLAVYDIGTSGPGTYMVSELLEGQTLREYLLDGPLPVRKALDYAIQIANGLAAAHEKGIVHRDLKPENIFLTRDGRAKILDFGLAKLHRTLDPDEQAVGVTVSGLTDPGVVLGTVGYLSPEQVQARHVDARSDLFSFGSILHEMLTGTRAFRGDSAVETMNAILKEDPPDPAVQHDAPPLLTRIVRRCLEKSPDQRFQSARDLAFALDSVSLAGSSMSLSPIGSVRRPRRRVIAVAVLGLLGALMLLAIGLVAGRRTVAERPVPSFRRLTFGRGGAPSARFAPDGRSILYAAAWDGDPVRIFSTQTNRPESARLDLPDAGIEAVSSSSELLIMLGRHIGQFWETCTLARVPIAGGAPRPIANDVLGADWGAEDTIAIIRKVGSRFRLEYPIGHLLYESADGLNSPRVSRSGELVAFWANESGRMALNIVTRTGSKRTLTTIKGGVGRYVVWSPADDEVWFSSSDSAWGYQLRAVSLSGNLRVLLRLPATVYPQDLSPDGQRLILGVGALRSVARCLRAGETRERELPSFAGNFIRDLSPDGAVALTSETVAGTGSDVAYLQRTDGSVPIRLADAFPVSLSPDGKWIVTVKEAGAFTVLPTGAGDPKPIHVKGFDFFWWYPDSRHLLLSPESASTHTRCVSFDIDTAVQTPVTPEGFVCPLRPSPNGQALLLKDQDERWLTYETARGTRHEIRELARDARPLQWGADSRSLLVVRDWLPFAKIDRLELSTGQRRLLREIVVSDPAGFNPSVSELVMTPNGSYCYSYLQGLSELYVVEGLR